jgi:hypothetical protein
MFDVVSPLRYAGRDQVRQRAAEWSAAPGLGYDVG